MSRGVQRKVERRELKARLVSLVTSRRFRLALGLALLVFSVAYGSYLRLQIVWNSRELGYGPVLYELDPFQEYFVAEQLLEHGLDYLTYLNHYNNVTRIFWYPWGRDFTHSVYIGLPFFAVGTYQLARLLDPSLTLYEWMVYLPPLFFAVAAVGVYLAVREISSDPPAGLAALSYALLFNSRQLAGFTVKYSMGLAFIPLAVFFHLRAWRRKDYLSASLAGLALGLSALSWAGFNVVFAAMALHVLLVPFVRRPSARDVVLWVLEYAPLLVLQLAAPTYGIRYVTRSVGVLGPASVLMLALGYLVYMLGESRASEYLGVLSERPRLTYFALLVLAGLAGLYVVVSGGLALAGKAFAAVGLGTLTHVLVETVAEYQPSGAQEVLASLGIVAVFAVFSIVYLVLSSLARRREARYGWYLLLLAVALVVASLVYGRQELPLSQFVVSATMAAGLVVASLGSGLRDEHLFLVLLFSLAAVGTLNIAYFIYLLAVAATVLAGYLMHALISGAVSRKSGTLSRIVSVVLICIYLISLVSHSSTIWVRAYSTQLPTIVEASLGLNVEAPVWLDALRWIRENTPEDSVVVSWWDYGYWISVVGQRASVADGATINATQIEILADALTSPEERALDILVEYFRIRPDRLYVVAYEVFIVDAATLSFYPGPLVLGGRMLGADAAKGIAAIYKIAGKEPPVYVYTDPNLMLAVGLPDWASQNLTSVLLYKMLLDAAYRVWGPGGYRAVFAYRDPRNPPTIPYPSMSLFEPVYISTSQLFAQGPYSAYVLLAVYRPRLAP